MRRSMKLKTTIRLVTMVWLLMLSGKGMAQSAQSLVFNEIMASNAGVVISPAYNFDGWVELYNPTGTDINLSGMYLSDDANNLTRWKMPSDIGTIPAKGFLVVWLGSDDIKSNQAPFKL
ncbi:MAG: lamin tail domain-containing protein, partial [Prevotella sp.]|nr:lamin tail domain-containing protein [Prevotella sp.]